LLYGPWQTEVGDKVRENFEGWKARDALLKENQLKIATHRRRFCTLSKSERRRFCVVMFECGTYTTVRRFKGIQGFFGETLNNWHTWQTIQDGPFTKLNTPELTGYHEQWCTSWKMIIIWQAMNANLGSVKVTLFLEAVNVTSITTKCNGDSALNTKCQDHLLLILCCDTLTNGWGSLNLLLSKWKHKVMETSALFSTVLLLENTQDRNVISNSILGLSF